MDLAARRRLLAWYRRHGRDLPWRRTGDPYAILVSEVMLQQTRVDVVVPYFQRWMAAFPDLRTLAAAPEEDVLRLWSGLGYYRRARALHAAARAIVDRHGARVPGSLDELRALPGVGEYTAGAVASIAFGVRAPAVDGNVVRVASRLAGLQGDPASAALRKRVAALAAVWLPARGAGDWNQALMELGATVCTPKPRCAGCPVAAACVARREGTADRLPAARSRRPSTVERVAFAVIRRGARILLVRNPPGLLAGLWGLPGGGPARRLAEDVRAQTGHRVRATGRRGRARHAFSHRTWEMAVHVASCGAGRPGAATRDTRWVREDRLAEVPMATATKVALRAVGVRI